MPIRILICDDHQVVRAGLRLILEQTTEFVIVDEVARAEDAIVQAHTLQPDLVLLDLAMPGLGGLEAIPRVREVAPQTRVVVLTMHEDEAYFFRALRVGAAGYVLKGASADELLAALRLVLQGGVPIPSHLGQHLLAEYLDHGAGRVTATTDPLSPREHEVVRLIAQGATNKEVAERLFISVRTVERHRSAIMRKLRLHNSAELVRYAVEHGILDREAAELQPGED
jgi:two-component system response regulator NreC